MKNRTANHLMDLGTILTLMLIADIACTPVALCQPIVQPHAVHLTPGVTIKGAILSVDPHSKTIEIQNYRGIIRNIVVDGTVQIYRQKQPVKLRELQSGNLVIVKS